MSVKRRLVCYKMPFKMLDRVQYHGVNLGRFVEVPNILGLFVRPPRPAFLSGESVPCCLLRVTFGLLECGVRLDITTKCLERLQQRPERVAGGWMKCRASVSE